MSLPVRPLHKLFAAEVASFDMAAPLDASAAAAIEAAMNRHAVLVFHDQRIDADQQLGFTRWFGPLDIGRKKAVATKSRLADEAMIDLSNLDPDGAVADRNSRKILSNMARGCGTPTARTSVRRRNSRSCRLMPCRPGAGETEFCDLRAAYDALPERLKAEIAELFAEHWVHHSRATLGFEPTPDEIKAAMPPVRWPLVRTHAGSGRKLLYLGAHASHIVGMSVPEGRILLRDLLEHATPARLRLPPQLAGRRRGDVGQPRGAASRLPLRPDVPRDMRRTTVEDSVSLDELDPLPRGERAG